MARPRPARVYLQGVGVAEREQVAGAVRHGGAHGERARGGALGVRVRGAGRAVVRQQARARVQRARARAAAAHLERVHLPHAHGGPTLLNTFQHFITYFNSVKFASEIDWMYETMIII